MFRGSHQKERIGMISQLSDPGENFCGQRIIFDRWKHGLIWSVYSLNVKSLLALPR